MTDALSPPANLPWPIVVMGTLLVYMGLPPPVVALAACGAMIGSVFAPPSGRIKAVFLFCAATLVSAEAGVLISALAIVLRPALDQIPELRATIRDFAAAIFGILLHPAIGVVVELKPAIRDYLIAKIKPTKENRA